MKYQDPFQAECPSCGVLGQHSVRSLLALEARCAGCGATLETLGREMNAQLAQWTTYFDKVETSIQLEKEFGIADPELEGASRMTQDTISSIAPFFIVADVPATLTFYRDMLGFEITFRGPSPEDEFFGIVRRGGAMIMFKALGVISDGKEVTVDPVPNYGRQPAFSWDAWVEVSDPDALAAEFASRGVAFSIPLANNDDDGLRGFVIKDLDGYGLFFGRLRS